jgi:hypothetical protein
MYLIRKIKTAASWMVRKPEVLLLAAGRNGLLNFIPDKLYLKIVFRAETGYKLNLKHPKTYNEKLQWIKLYDRRPEYTMYADKFAVREYIAKTLGEEYLVPLIGVYDRAEEIPWDDLPDRFVLKCTHGSGTNIICRDKNKLDRVQAVKDLNRWLKKNYFWAGREWCYKNIRPRIICEQYLDAGNGMTPDDYKFMCFNGEPRIIQLHHDRFGKHTLTYYTTDWERTDIKRIDEDTALVSAEKPQNLSEMLGIARRLSRDMYYARIDLYDMKGRIYFGEITLYPTSGFSTFARYEDDEMLGSWLCLDLPPEEE